MDSFNNTVLLTCIWLFGLMNFGNTYGQDLEKYQWKNRLLIIQTSERSSEKFQEQTAEFQKGSEGLKDRKLVVYHFTKDHYRILNYEGEEKNKPWQRIKKKYQNIANGRELFKVILIGLDGGIKLETKEVLRKKTLYATIDAMPMRIRELNRKYR